VSRFKFFVLGLVCAALVAFYPTAAQASSTVLCTGYSSCAGKNYSHFGYATKKSTSYWRMYTGTNCTNYVAYRLVTTNKMPNTRPKAGVGNARDWGTAMKSVTNATPTLGSVAWWGKTGNHVAYVEKIVSSSEIWVSESNWSGEFDWRKITKSGTGWPDGFIHFADLTMTSTAAPAISGTVKVGSKVTASTGTWTPAAKSYTYAWRLDGKAINGATASTYTPTAGQEGKALTVAVTATTSGYPPTTAVSAKKTISAGAVAVTKAPSIAGTPRVGSTLTASPGTWTPTDVKPAYQWLVGGTPVVGATSSSFAPRQADSGKAVAVKVTAAKTGYSAASATSAPVTVAGAPLTSTKAPTLSGTAQVGRTLTADPGGWSQTGATFAYTWLAGGAVITGASGRTYELRASDVGKPITVKVTATRTGFSAGSATSKSTHAVAMGTFSSSAPPAIAGTRAVGQTLTASTGTWNTSGTVLYQWFSGSTRIPGATSRTFVPTAAMLGTPMRVRVAMRRDGFASAYTDSRPTIPLAEGTVRFTGRLPAITGTLQVGQTLTADPGTYTPTDAKVQYRWYRDGAVLPKATSRTYRLTEADLGTAISARVLFDGPAHAERRTYPKTTGTVTSPSRIAVKATPAAKQVTFLVVVAAPGVPKPGGTVTITWGTSGRKVVTLTGDRATVTLPGQASGPQRYRLRYDGTRLASPVETATTVTIG
jgi:surface antigen